MQTYFDCCLRKYFLFLFFPDSDKISFSTIFFSTFLTPAADKPVTSLAPEFDISFFSFKYSIIFSSCSVNVSSTLIATLSLLLFVAIKSILSDPVHTVLPPPVPSSLPAPRQRKYPAHHSRLSHQFRSG